MMLAIAILPVFGLGWLATARIADASAHRRDVQQVNTALDDLVDHVELGSHIANEKHWNYAARSLDAMGIEPQVVVEIVDLDPWNELAATEDLVEEAAVEAGAQDLLDRIEQIRHDHAFDPIEANLAYGEVEDEVHERRQAASQVLLDLPRGGLLASAVRSLQAAADLRDDMAIQLAAFFSLRFAGELSSTEAMRLLIASDGRYDENLVQLRGALAPGSRTDVALTALEQNPDVRQWAMEVDGSVARTVAEGAEESTRLDVEDVFGDAARLADVFLAADASLNQHMSLVQVTADDVVHIAGVMDAAAASDARQAMLVGIGLTLASIIAAVLVGRAIVVPLRRMSAVADAMREGSLDQRAEQAGPRELQSAARALNEAVAQMRLSERQALALARGDLDDPILETPVPGSLGRSLREAVSHLAASLSEREDYRRRLAHEAAHDGLTGLPNRTASLAHLGRALSRAERTGDMLAVLIVDLDGFKQLNEMHGHWAGDRVLVQVAQRLSTTVRQSDVVGRLGADEFIVVAEPVGDDDEANALALRLVEELGVDMAIGGVNVSTGGCVGIATSHGGSDPDALIREANLAVTEAKHRGRGQIRFCDDDMRFHMASRGAVERGLAAAIENDELTLHFQQLVDARTEQPVSMEALVRWTDPERGMVSPGEFIPVAEASDLIIALDRWVLGKAADQLATWGAHPELRGLTLAVNLSERHLGHPHLVDHVLEPLKRAGVDPGRLVIEVTETALLDDLASAAAQLSTLRAHGVMVAIDDFGTGYTSLSHLRALPVDVLKVDQSFVSNLVREDDRSLVRMIVEVGHLFGLEVVAEGVETATEARELLRLGVDTLQGFYYSRPSPPDVLEAKVAASAPRSRSIGVGHDAPALAVGPGQGTS